MKHLIFILLIISLFGNNSMAQEATVEEDLWGIQIGIPPLIVYNETGLTESIALRSELGLGVAFSSSSGYLGHSSYWAVMPFLELEPRFYYNLKKRLSKGKRIDGNSGNYLALRVGFQPGLWNHF